MAKNTKWKKDYLGNIGSFTKGAPLSKADISRVGSPLVLYGELYTTYGEVTYHIHRRTNKIVDQQCYSKIGDIIIPTSGETAEDIATACCIMVPNVVLGGDLNIFRVSEEFDGRFISYVINHVVNNKISEVAQGISIIHINAKELGKIEISFPEYSEQKAIADTLEVFDQHINNLTELIEKKRNIRDGALEDLLCCRIRLPGFNDEWKEKVFDEFMKINRGASPRPIEHYITTNRDGVNWIKIGDAPRFGKYITATEERITQSGAAHSKRVNAGDFILSNSMSFGRPYLLAIDGCIHDGWLRLYDFQSDACSDFLFYLLSSSYVKKQYETLAAGSGVQNLNKEVVKQVIVNLPSIPEQKAIANVLTSMDEEIEALEKEREKIQQIREGAIDRLLTGCVRLSC